MNENVPPRVKIVRKPSLPATLMAMQIGVKQRFQNRDFKIQIMKNGITALKKKGYDFQVTEKGLVNEYDVTRLK